LLLGLDSLIQPLDITRLPHPGLSFLVLLLAVYLTSEALALGGRLRLLGAGLVCGLLFNTYYFYWLGLFLGFGVLFLISLANRRFEMLTRLVLIGLTAAAVGLPYWLRVFQAQRQGGQADLLGRVGYYTRTVSWKGFAVFTVATALLTILCRRVGRLQAFPDATPTAKVIPPQVESPGQRAPLGGRGGLDRPLALVLLLLSVLAGAGLGCNFQLLTGYNAQHAHFWNRLIQPTSFLVLGCALGFVLERAPKRLRWFPLTLVVMAAAACVSLAAYRQVQVAIRTGDDHRCSSPRMDALRWLRAHIPPDRVVGTFDVETTMLIPAITGNWTFVPVGDRTMASDQEILTRFLLMAYLEGRSPEEVQDRLPEKPPGFHNWASAVFVLWTRYVFDPASRQEVSRQLDLLFTDREAARELKARRLDYVIVPKDRCDNVRRVFPEAQPIYTNEEWSILDLRRATVPSGGA
jgi:hypothetical protein